MNNIINDIENNLNDEIDISNSKNNKASISKITGPTISDLGDNFEEKVNVKNTNNIKITKNNTPSFDSFLVGDEEDEIIDLVTPKKDTKYYFQNIKNFFNKHYKKIKLGKEKTKNNTHPPKGILVAFFHSIIGAKGKPTNSEKLNIFQTKNFARVGLFILLLIVVGLSSKIAIEKCVTSGYENILALKNDFKDLKKAIGNVERARIQFFAAKVLLFPISFIPNENIQNVKHLINGGNDLSKLLIKTTNIGEKVGLELYKNKGVTNISFTSVLEDIRDNYSEVYSLFYSSLANFSKVGDMGDENLNAKLKFVKENLFLGLNILEVIDSNYDEILSLFGNNTTRKYLVVFQNNDEIRPTGGFMGSTAIITIRDGKIIDVENSDIYALEWDINKVYINKERAPEGLNQITTTFGIRDANYYPLFRDSSQKIKSFLDMANYELDGIVYINQNIILDLLAKVGGVDSKILEMKIDDKNFSLVLSTLVEAKVFKVGTLGSPKQVLFDFAGELYNKLIGEKKYYDYANILLKHIQNRDIVFYSFNPIENSLLWKLGLNGEINLNEKLDFNYPVYTSIGGNKTDRYKEYRYDKIVDKAPNSCDFVTKLEIYNSHMFSQFEDDKVNALLDSYEVEDKTDILNIQGRGDNRSYLRVLIPKNAEVYPNTGQIVYDYENYKIVELYVTTQKLETSRNTIQYTIKNPNCEDYSYKFFKQPGIVKYNINFDVLGEEYRYSGITTDFIYKLYE